MPPAFFSRLKKLSLPFAVEGHFWSISFDNISESEVVFSTKILDDEYLATVNRQVKKEDRWRLIISRAALKFILASYLNCSMSELIILKSSYGKPYLSSGICQFNLSHASDMGFVGIHPQRSLGVDVEKICNIEHLVSLFLLPCERELGNPIQLWCAKEALVKCLGTGFSIHPLPVLEKRNGIFYSNGIQIFTFEGAGHCFAVACPDVERSTVENVQ